MIKNLDNHVWMWVGKGANSREAIAAEESIDVIVQSLSNPKVLKIYEEKETPAFWFVLSQTIRLFRS